MWTNAGEGVIESIGQEKALFKNVYASNGMPDKSANGMFSYAKSKGLDWGTIDTIPEIPGLAVRMEGHVGVYIGNGEVIEERGFNYGCVKTLLKNRKWLHWYKIPTINYITDSITPAQEKEIALGSRLLKKGISVTDVKELQKLLNSLLNLNLTIDGEYGSATEAAVKKFQSKAELTIDGKYGAQSHAALMSTIADNNPTFSEEKEKEDTVKKQYVTTASTDVRVGNGASYQIITTLDVDTQIDPILNANNEPLVSANEWYAIKILDRIGWINGKYIK